MFKNMKKRYVSWNEIDELVNSLTQQITQSGIQIENIFGLQRGGLIPAVMISHKLGIPMTKGTISQPTFYSSIWNSSDWLSYPWEREDSNAIQDYKF